MTAKQRITEILKVYTKKHNISASSVILEEYAEELVANGAIVPPCKVGETVYCLIQGFENPLKATVNRITVQVSGVVISCSVLGYFGQSYMATDFGKTVFLTKEEAEAELQKRGKENAENN